MTMKPTPALPALLAPLALLALALATTPSRADSVASSASSAGSASLGSLSTSIGESSDASSGKREVADGDYRVIEVADLAERPAMLRLTLRAAQPRPAGLAEFRLDLPREALARRGLAVGDLVQARQRPYGLEFAYAQPAREAFFLVLADDWHRELDPRAVQL
jgi:hypothetical protein